MARDVDNHSRTKTLHTFELNCPESFHAEVSPFAPKDATCRHS
jgi:hypothetical protein